MQVQHVFLAVAILMLIPTVKMKMAKKDGTTSIKCERSFDFPSTPIKCMLGEVFDE
jgi:hypothetical protein